MRSTTIRLPDDIWRQLEQEARRSDVSRAQYAREAIIMRIGAGTQLWEHIELRAEVAQLRARLERVEHVLGRRVMRRDGT